VRSWRAGSQLLRYFSAAASQEIRVCQAPSRGPGREDTLPPVWPEVRERPWLQEDEPGSSQRPLLCCPLEPAKGASFSEQPPTPPARNSSQGPAGQSFQSSGSQVEGEGGQGAAWMGGGGRSGAQSFLLRACSEHIPSPPGPPVLHGNGVTRDSP
jgi:hypothetical protein